MTLVKFNPEKKQNGLMTGFNDVFDSIFNDTFFSDRMVSRVPAANISETDDHYHVGLSKEDFKLRLERDVLSISVEQTQQTGQQERTFNKREFSYNSFVRSFTLPDMADQEGISAKYENGVLAIEIPKKEDAKMASRQIEIK